MRSCTLGTGEDAQEFDSYTGGATEKKFILHYNFPNYSVGETGRISGPGRREIGHGALAERSLEPMLPLDTYPYADPRHERNHGIERFHLHGHPFAAARLALMDAGVPMTRPVAGISIGICTEHDDKDKISALQTPDRHHRLGRCVLRHGLQNRRHRKGHHRFPTRPQAARHSAQHHGRSGGKSPRRPHRDPRRNGARHLAGPRTEMSKYAPRIETMKINPEKIGALIGPGGKNIKRLVEESGCEINIEDDGTVNIYSVSAEGMKIAREAIKA